MGAGVILAAFLAAGGCTAAGPAASTPAPAAANGRSMPAGFEADRARYYRLLDNICWTGVTPEMVQLRERIVRAMDAAKYGGGRDGNFVGVTRPEHAWAECGEALRRGRFGGRLRGRW